METLGHQHQPDEFTDSSKVNLKAVLLQISNKFPSIAVVHAIDVKKTYENLKLVLKKIQSEKYDWNVCGNFKVIGLLFILQLGYTKCCFLCKWDCRHMKSCCVRKLWFKRESLISVEKNESNTPLVNPGKAYFCYMLNSDGLPMGCLLYTSRCV